MLTKSAFIDNWDIDLAYTNLVKNLTKQQLDLLIFKCEVELRERYEPNKPSGTKKESSVVKPQQKLAGRT